ncbi:MAG: hypothetical protein EB156_05295 [Euryarchaeota archaeon]|nr:hypothetical protein [Euryarchaeota archaeon]NDG22029.1 hypothetical protein [Euryarchaeota archaeon]
MILDEDEGREAVERIVDNQTVLPTWAYLTIFVFPGLSTFLLMNFYLEIDTLLSAVTSLAIMNGSINSIIAWLTIRLDGQSAEALEHLDTIMIEMERLETTLDEANQKVDSFTVDLEEARVLFRKVGVEINDLDLEPVADVVEKLKENKDGLGEVLDNLRGVDVSTYIDQAKRIEWKKLLNSVEEIMSFINTQDPDKPKPKLPTPSIGMPKLPILPTPEPVPTPEPTIDELIGNLDEEEEEDWLEWDDDEDDEFFNEAPKPNLNPSRPKKEAESKKDKNLNLSRFG